MSHGLMVGLVVAVIVGTGGVAMAAPTGMVLIPGGVFEMGCHIPSPTCPSDELPLHGVLLDTFYMDVLEVTNQQYADALNWAYGLRRIDDPSMYSGVVQDSATGTVYCRTTESDPDLSRITWDAGMETFGVTPDKGDHPMALVTWFGAVAYANWRSEQEGRTPSYNLSTWECDFYANGYRLPTEAEWEYAARGGEHDPYYRYPWGDSIDGTLANYVSSGDPFECGDSDHPTTPVGFYDGSLHQRADFNWPCTVDSYQTSNHVNGYGLYDVSGNVWEWCNDFYDSEYYGVSPYDNPRGPATAPKNVLRGSTWHGDELTLRNAYRGAVWTQNSATSFGFRLALDSESDPVPAVSEWALILMTLLVLTAGTLVYERRRPTRA